LWRLVGSRVALYINAEELNEDGDDDRDEFYATIQYLR
jgi:hypothetical protein